jgi:4-carboxymuconolactone decarboxylase
MKIIHVDQTQAKFDPSRADDFEGEVKFQIVVGPVDSDELDLTNVCFSAGARTRPRIHQDDQVLEIIEGEGTVATESERQVVTVGQVIIIPKGVWHWHGATRRSSMCHLSIKKRGPTDWKVPEKNWRSEY